MPRSHEEATEYAFARWVEQPVSPYAERRVPTAIEDEITTRVDRVAAVDERRHRYRTSEYDRDRFERELRSLGVPGDVVITIVAVEEYQAGRITSRQFARLVDEHGVGYEPFPFRETTLDERDVEPVDRSPLATKKRALYAITFAIIVIVVVYLW